jgi:hypothetical protein
MNEVSVKESKEFLKMLGVLAYVGGAVAEDGKIGLEDLGAMSYLAMNFKTITDGASGLDQALVEMKDLEMDEVIELIKEGYIAVESFQKGKRS